MVMSSPTEASGHSSGRFDWGDESESDMLDEAVHGQGVSDGAGYGGPWRTVKAVNRDLDRAGPPVTRFADDVARWWLG